MKDNNVEEKNVEAVIRYSIFSELGGGESYPSPFPPVFLRALSHSNS